MEFIPKCVVCNTNDDLILCKCRAVRYCPKCTEIVNEEKQNKYKYINDSYLDNHEEACFIISKMLESLPPTIEFDIGLPSLYIIRDYLLNGIEFKKDKINFIDIKKNEGSYTYLDFERVGGKDLVYQKYGCDLEEEGVMMFYIVLGGWISGAFFEPVYADIDYINYLIAETILIGCDKYDELLKIHDESELDLNQV